MLTRVIMVVVYNDFCTSNRQFTRFSFPDRICTHGPLSEGIIRLDDDVIKWKHFPRYWPFVRGIHRSPVNSPHKGQWRGALMVPLICTWTNAWTNNRDAGDLRRNRAHYDVTVKGTKVIHQPTVNKPLGTWNRLGSSPGWRDELRVGEADYTGC